MNAKPASEVAWWKTAHGASVFVALVAAAASVGGAVISWSASATSTEQEYVALAMEILRDSESTQSARNWAVGVMSDLSPTEVTPEMASGLLTGKAVLPAQLDPAATRREILECMKPLTESEFAGPVDPAPLPEAGEDRLAEFKNWVIFSIEQTGQLEKANGRIDTYQKVVSNCVQGPLSDIEDER